MAVVVDVQRNNVDRALKKLNTHFKEAGMVEECRSREYRRTSAEEKFARNRAAHNKRVGVQISDRLKWVIRRRKLKM
jgi:ribosomal protein S21